MALIIEIKVNEDTIHRYSAVRLESFKGNDQIHEYIVSREEFKEAPFLGLMQRTRIVIGKVSHRYDRGAVGLARKVLAIAERSEKKRETRLRK